MVPTECLFRQPVGFHNPALFQQVRLLRPSLHHEVVCERGQRRRDEEAIGRQSSLLQSQSARTGKAATGVCAVDHCWHETCLTCWAGEQSLAAGLPEAAHAFGARFAGSEIIARAFVAMILFDGSRDVFLTGARLILTDRLAAVLA
jgi:hypothetical protein